MTINLYDAIKARYGYELNRELMEDELKKLVAGNMIPSDHIIRDGEVLNIYTDNVSILEICKFFKSRIPGIKFEINDHVLNLTKADQILLAKYVVYTQLSLLLTEVTTPKAKEVFIPIEKQEPYIVDGKTLH